MNCECVSDKAINTYTNSIYSLREAYFIFIVIFMLGIISVSIYIITNENVTYEPQWDYGLKLTAILLTILLLYSTWSYYTYPGYLNMAIWPKLIIVAICCFLIAFGTVSLGTDETKKDPKPDNEQTISPLIKIDNDTISIVNLLMGIIILFLTLVELGLGLI